MKKNRLRGLMALLMLLMIAPLSAQTQGEPLPVDPAVRIGKLPNGLTYIIRHNAQPKERAHFYIAQKVGSTLEEENQRGLAHFLEHMAFNGTNNFPDKGIIDYLEKKGVQFGNNLNAYTGFDETVYTMMNVPVSDRSVVDSCILILHDWSHNLTLNDEEIDKERGVVTEEWRSGNDAQGRLQDKMIEHMVPGSIYAKRLPIGDMSVIKNFKYQELKDYYKKWYRPDLQGLIIVGDIDVDYVENQIKETFKDIPAPVNPAPRTYAEIPTHTEPNAGVITDKEAPSSMLFIIFKHDALPKEAKASMTGLVIDYMNDAVSTMMSERIDDLLQKGTPPFIAAFVEIGPLLDIVPTKDALTVVMMAKEGALQEGMNAIMAEINRVVQHGFTPSEYDRARNKILARYDDLLKGLKNRTNEQYAEEYSDYFLCGGYIPGIEVERQMFNMVAPSLGVEQLNSYFKSLVTKQNISIVYTGPEKEGVKPPTDTELLAYFKEAQAQEVEPYVETLSDTKLIETPPTPGKIVKVEPNQALGTTLWTLSNGAKVYVRHSDLKDDEILLRAYSPGGSYLYDREKEPSTFKILNQFTTIGGLGNFSNSDLTKVLSGRNIDYDFSIEKIDDRIDGRANERDLETLFQAIYLRFTANRKDPEAFKAMQQRLVQAITAAQGNPMFPISNDSIPALLYPGVASLQGLSTKDLEQYDYDRALQIFNERFANAGDFTFFITGSYDEATLKSLVETYIASLPSQPSAEPRLIDRTDRVTDKGRVNNFSLPLDNPTAVIRNIFVFDRPCDMQTKVLTKLLDSILDQQYTTTIREEEGGTYGVSSYTTVTRAPLGETQLNIQFRCKPTEADRLNKRILDELHEMADKGINPVYFNKAKEIEIKEFAEDIRENQYWLNRMAANFYFGDKDAEQYEDILKATTIEELQAFVKGMLKDARYFQLIAKSTKTE